MKQKAEVRRQKSEDRRWNARIILTSDFCLLTSVT
jgi:hypothetical protein